MERSDTTSGYARVAGERSQSPLRKRIEREQLSFMLTHEAVRAVDRAAIEEFAVPGIVLMENAACGLADAAIELLDRLPAPHESSVKQRTLHALIICGGGNNGGDGYALARHLHNFGVKVTLMPIADPRTDSDAAINRTICERLKLPFTSSDDRSEFTPSNVDLVVDAIFGTGLDREITGTARETIDWVNSLNIPVLAVDMPSGLHGDTGEILGVCTKAAMTGTFVALKPAFQQLDAQRYLGEVRVINIGAPRELIERFGTPLPEPPPGLVDPRQMSRQIVHSADR